MAGLYRQLPGGGAAAAPPAGVERVVRRSAAASYEFLINHTDAPVRIPLAGGGHELLSATDVTAAVELPPQGVAIVRRLSGSPSGRP
jgi:beta-galactosidase